MVIVARLSDIVGRKPVYVLSVLASTTFSGGCASASTMAQLQVPVLPNPTMLRFVVSFCAPFRVWAAVDVTP